MKQILKKIKKKITNPKTSTLGNLFGLDEKYADKLSKEVLDAFKKDKTTEKVAKRIGILTENHKGLAYKSCLFGRVVEEMNRDYHSKLMLKKVLKEISKD